MSAHLARTALAQPLSERLRQPTRGIHQHGPCSYQYSPRTDHRQVRLRFRTPVTYWTQKVRIDTR
jgi:hypothetical protein